MKNIKLVSLLLSLVMIFCSLSLFSCGKTPDTHGDPEEETATKIHEEITSEENLGKNQTENPPETETEEIPVTTLPIGYAPPTDELILAQSRFAVKLFKETVRQRESTMDAAMIKVRLPLNIMNIPFR